MKRFAYKALSTTGEPVEGEMDAADEAGVIESLQSSGYLPITASEIKLGNFARSFSLFSKRRVKQADVHHFTRELATMLDAGLPLATALATLVGLTDRSGPRDLIEKIRAEVEAGVSLSSAVENTNGVFPKFYGSLLRAGEASGTLHLVLERLAEYHERNRQLQNAVWSALLYPAILLFVAGSSLVVLLIFVVPQFQPLFEDLGQALPVSTQIVVAMAEILRRFWWLAPLLVLAATSLLRSMLANPNQRQNIDTLLLATPLLGGLITRIEMTRLCRTLGTLITNGVTLLEGVRIVRDAANNSVIGRALDTVAVDLEQGRTLAQPLADAKCFPPLAIQLVRVGEETGALAPMLMKLANIYDEETQSAIKRMLTILEPVLILILGLLIAFIIVSILLAILGLNELVA